MFCLGFRVDFDFLVLYGTSNVTGECFWSQSHSELRMIWCSYATSVPYGIPSRSHACMRLFTCVARETRQKFHVSGLLAMSGHCLLKGGSRRSALLSCMNTCPLIVYVMISLRKLLQVLHRHLTHFVVRSDVLLSPEGGRSGIWGRRGSFCFPAISETAALRPDIFVQNHRCKLRGGILRPRVSTSHEGQRNLTAVGPRGGYIYLLRCTL